MVSYFTLLGKLFRSMQRCRKYNTHNRLEPYVIFGLTKIDHPQAYKKAMGIRAEQSFFKSIR